MIKEVLSVHYLFKWFQFGELFLVVKFDKFCDEAATFQLRFHKKAAKCERDPSNLSKKYDINQSDSTASLKWHSAVN